MKPLICMLAAAVLSVSATSCGNDNGVRESVAAMTDIQKQDPPRSKSVLIISSSPRRGGNSETLCSQFKKGAEESGHRVEMLNINDYDINFFDRKEYIRGVEDSVRDDASMIISKMADADVIVLSSPVYFYSMTGQMKTLIDRTYNHEKSLGEKEFYYIVTATDRDREALSGTIEGFRGFIRCLYKSVERGVVYGNGARECGAILEHPAMQEAYDMGRNV